MIQKGLYKKSECFVFNIEKQEDEIISAESFEELSEMYLEGNTQNTFMMKKQTLILEIKN